MAIFKRRGRRKRRYPIRRDDEGRSARSRCFELFEKGAVLQDIADMVGVKIETVYKYHQQWKTGSHLDERVATLKKMLAKKAPGRDETVISLAKLFRIDREQLEAILARPHGLRGLISGKVHLTSEEDNDRRRKALELGWLIADHLVYDGGQFEDVLYAFDELMDESKRYRKSDEERTTFIRGVLSVFDEQEKEGRGIRDRLTAQERGRIFYYAARVKKKQTETAYWTSIVGMMAEDGLTVEQAREKMYQDLLKEGKTWAAERLRAFQDEVHPLKPDSPPPATTG